MQVRLGFSITVSVERPILLVDEVLAVGDIDFQKKCYNAFDNFKKAGRTILFVSHDLSSIGKFSDRIIHIEEGRSMSELPVSQSIERYLQRASQTKHI